MGQILSHGVYLPNEGERNCYAGLASNWQILNTAVGAIAEKAPLVHTHTVSQITDFPAYGTTAGTICEGNDSRLSDARTPVAHTHGKADITDLLNSDFIPSANNSYDLGSSSYQWNNLYAKRVNTQSVNGINPGALSLPSASYIDISSSITDRNYGANYYTAPSNGYVCIGSMASSLQISNDTLGFGISAGTAQDGYSSVYIPVRTGDTVRIQVNQTSTDYQTFRFYSCQGNV